MNEHDLVAMTEDRPGDDLRKGDVGTVVHLYKDGRTYEVEFIDEHGRTRCVATVPTHQVMRLNYLSRLAAWDRQIEADARGGRLDPLADEALGELGKARCNDL